MNDDILVCRDLVKNYGTTTALNGINLNIKSGKIVGLLGPNGSGKTTLIKIAAGLLRKTSGELLIGGNEPGEQTKAIVSYLPDCDFLPRSMKVDMLIDYCADFFTDFDRNKAKSLVTGFGLRMNMMLKSMSKGMREKMHLSIIMARSAKLYLLDEPIGGVDPAARDLVLRTILDTYNKDATIIISTHLIYDVEKVLDEAVFINYGNIVLHDEVDKIIADSGKSLDARFREDFRC